MSSNTPIEGDDPRTIDVSADLIRAMIRRNEPFINIALEVEKLYTSRPSAVQGDDWLDKQLHQIISRHDGLHGITHNIMGGKMLSEEHCANCRETAKSLEAAIQAQVDEAVREADVRGEIKGKRLALEKMRMGAGEFHDDPHEYVVPLRHVKQYEAELSVFDLSDPSPIFRDKQLTTTNQDGEHELDDLVLNLVQQVDCSDISRGKTINADMFPEAKAAIQAYANRARIDEVKRFPVQLVLYGRERLKELAKQEGGESCK